MYKSANNVNNLTQIYNTEDDYDYYPKKENYLSPLRNYIKYPTSPARIVGGGIGSGFCSVCYQGNND